MSSKLKLVSIDIFIDCDATPFIPEEFVRSWSVKKNTKAGMLKLNGHKWHRFLANDHMNIKTPWNSNVLKRLMENHQCIPEKAKGRYIKFGGTTFCNRNNGREFNLVLYWNKLRSDWSLTSAWPERIKTKVSQEKKERLRLVPAASKRQQYKNRRGNIFRI